MTVVIPTLPPRGRFLRPIGLHRFGYTMRVVGHVDPENALDHPAIEYERWGVRGGMPVDDGNVRRGYYLSLCPTLLPGVWRYPPKTPDDGGWSRDGYRNSVPSVQRWETYYRLIDQDERGQMELFS